MKTPETHIQNLYQRPSMISEPSHSKCLNTSMKTLRHRPSEIPYSKEKVPNTSDSNVGSQNLKKKKKNQRPHVPKLDTK